MSKKHLTSPPTPTLDISKKLVAKMRTGELKIKPKVVYWLGTALLFFGIVLATVVSIFSISVIRFLLKQHGPMGQLRFSQLLSTIPWWLPLLMLVSVLLGIWLIKKVEFGYKIVSWQLLLMTVVALMLGGMFAEHIGLTQYLMGVGRRFGANSGITPFGGGMMHGRWQNGTKPQNTVGKNCWQDSGESCVF